MSRAGEVTVHWWVCSADQFCGHGPANARRVGGRVVNVTKGAIAEAAGKVCK
jgi:hypothetical protein